MHLVAPLSLVYLPSAQRWQGYRPVALYEPGRHSGRQPEPYLSAATYLVPSGQSFFFSSSLQEPDSLMQVVAPAPSVLYPSGQLRQGTAPVREYSPGLHSDKHLDMRP